MASAKMFLGNKPSRNEDVAKSVKSGSKHKIVAVEEKEDSASNEPKLCIQVKGYDFWMKVNKLCIPGMIDAYGDETDGWVGKGVVISHVPCPQMGTGKVQLTISPG